MAYREVSETAHAVEGRTYRTTYYIGGPFPPGFITFNLSRVLIATGKTTGRFQVLSTESFGKGFLPEAPADAWAFRLTWRKLGSGTPLLFFTGPGGIITLAIVGVIVGVVGALILARRFEELIDEIPEVMDWVPALILGAVLILGLKLRGRAAA